jgi:hypothetical protein
MELEVCVLFVGGGGGVGSTRLFIMFRSGSVKHAIGGGVKNSTYQFTNINMRMNCNVFSKSIFSKNQFQWHANKKVVFILNSN